MATKLTIITGPSGSGKSTWCLQLAEKARVDGATVGGLLSPSVLCKGRKVGIDLLDLTSGERRRLANPRTEATNRPVTSCWQFEPQTFVWANQVLRDLPPCDMVIIDELGPLEFVRGEGLEEGLRLIDARQIPMVYVVVRPELLSQAVDRWPWARIVEAGKESVIADTEGGMHQ